MADAVDMRNLELEVVEVLHLILHLALGLLLRRENVPDGGKNTSREIKEKMGRVGRGSGLEGR